MTSYTGVVTLVGEPEIGQSGNEKPRKVQIGQSLLDERPKTFRMWSNSEDFLLLERGKKVTVNYEINPIPNTTFKQNMITSVQVSGNGTQPPTTADWSPPPSPDTPETKSDYWERREDADRERTLQIESAWALKAVLDIEGPDHGLDDDSLAQFAIRLILLKRRIASEMS